METRVYFIFASHRSWNLCKTRKAIQWKTKRKERFEREKCWAPSGREREGKKSKEGAFKVRGISFKSTYVFVLLSSSSSRPFFRSRFIAFEVMLVCFTCMSICAHIHIYVYSRHSFLPVSVTFALFLILPPPFPFSPLFLSAKRNLSLSLIVFLFFLLRCPSSLCSEVRTIFFPSLLRATPFFTAPGHVTIWGCLQHTHSLFFLLLSLFPHVYNIPNISVCVKMPYESERGTCGHEKTGTRDSDFFFFVFFHLDSPKKNPE